MIAEHVDILLDPPGVRIRVRPLFAGGKQVSVRVLLQIRPVEPAEAHIHADLAEDADLERHHGIIEADASEKLQIEIDPQLGEKFGAEFRVGGIGGRLIPGGDGVHVHLRRTADLQLHGKGHGADHVVPDPGVREAAAQIEAAVQHGHFPFAGGEIIVDHGFHIALHLVADIAQLTAQQNLVIVVHVFHSVLLQSVRYTLAHGEQGRKLLKARLVAEAGIGTGVGIGVNAGHVALHIAHVDLHKAEEFGGIGGGCELHLEQAAAAFAEVAAGHKLHRFPDELIAEALFTLCAGAHSHAHPLELAGKGIAVLHLAHADQVAHAKRERFLAAEICAVAVIFQIHAAHDAGIHHALQGLSIQRDSIGGKQLACEIVFGGLLRRGVRGELLLRFRKELDFTVCSRIDAVAPPHDHGFQLRFGKAVRGADAPCGIQNILRHAVILFGVLYGGVLRDHKRLYFFLFIGVVAEIYHGVAAFYVSGLVHVGIDLGKIGVIRRGVIALLYQEGVMHLVFGADLVARQSPLGLVHNYLQLAVGTEVKALIAFTGNVCCAGGIQREARAAYIIPVHVHAAAEVDLAGIWHAVRFFEIQIGVSRPSELQVVAGIKLQLRRIALAGYKIGKIEGAEVDVAILAGGAAVNVALDAVFLIDRRRAGVIGIHGFFRTGAVFVRQRGLYLRVALEQIELILQRFNGHVHAVAHAGAHVGGGDRRLPVPKARDHEFGGGPIRNVAEIADILIQRALLVVHRGHVVVGGCPRQLVGQLHPRVFAIVGGNDILQRDISVHREHSRLPLGLTVPVQITEHGQI